MTPRQFTYVNHVKYDITGISIPPMTPYVFVSFETWNSKAHGILGKGHGAATHYYQGERVGYTCPVDLWICPIKRWEVTA